MDFKGKTAIATGAGSGIGAAIALELATRGTHVVVADTDHSSAVDTAGRIASKLGSMSSILGSVGRPNACAFVASKHALLSNQAGFLTGSYHLIDGGSTAR
ncbi:hypothetical protein DPM33_12180 [Mesorhizobium hawassense]|uniref:Short-chain dehydrogenase n=1 Tax=Mesorhizobium hawassense TaxID=1209954 RepID=A0A330HQP7_9HYPH|nr:SDR family NAD(P)-dependent oxidoreductase [Mesorhizobium hawassense]RAZ91026.1 hypothetical protein DPM33_12180 [Mesorhizobium hawassense]